MPWVFCKEKSLAACCLHKFTRVLFFGGRNWSKPEGGNVVGLISSFMYQQLFSFQSLCKLELFFSGVVFLQSPVQHSLLVVLLILSLHYTPLLAYAYVGLLAKQQQNVRALRLARIDTVSGIVLFLGLMYEEGKGVSYWHCIRYSPLPENIFECTSILKKMYPVWTYIASVSGALCSLFCEKSQKNRARERKNSSARGWLWRRSVTELSDTPPFVALPARIILAIS